MDKMKMETADKTLESLVKLKQMFPEVITETKDDNGNIVSAVDAKKLEQLLSTKVIDGGESYDFTWVGKKQAIVEASTPIRKTLRPCRKDSVNWDKTQNLYIEGDNLDVLKLLQESYLNKIKMIYIDPPYNTGNDFIYNDNFTMEKDEYEEGTDLRDEEGNKQFTQNSDSNPRFHSDWCSMMYPRLKLARNLLSEDGVIFISIDDNEVDNLRKICDEVFGVINFVACCPRKTRGSATTQSNAELQKLNDYMLIYWKNKRNSAFNLKNIGQKTYPYSDERGQFFIVPLQDNGPNGTRTARPNLYYPIYKSANGELSLSRKCSSDDELIPVKHKNDDGCWMWSKAKFEKDFKDLYVKDSKVYIKHYYNAMEDQNRYQREKSWLDDYQNSKGTVAVNELFPNNKGLFSAPKPVELLLYTLLLATNKDSIVLDFFSGSATTAHAVMQLNAEDGGHRKFIMVQLPEVCDEKSEAFKAGYKNICEIGKERIRRAGKKIVEETGKKDLDIGFRVLKLDDSNMKDVYYSPDKLDQKTLLDAVENIKPDRTAEDLLYACMLEWGLELSLPHTVKQMGGYNVHVVNENELIACFDKDVNEDTIKAIADMKPLRVVFRDHSFENDAARINVEEIFKLKSPNTDVKVI